MDEWLGTSFSLYDGWAIRPFPSGSQHRQQRLYVDGILHVVLKAYRTSSLAFHRRLQTQETSFYHI